MKCCEVAVFKNEIANVIKAVPKLTIIKRSAFTSPWKEGITYRIKDDIFNFFNICLESPIEAEIGGKLFPLYKQLLYPPVVLEAVRNLVTDMEGAPFPHFHEGGGGENLDFCLFLWNIEGSPCSYQYIIVSTMKKLRDVQQERKETIYLQVIYV